MRLRYKMYACLINLSVFLTAEQIIVKTFEACAYVHWLNAWLNENQYLLF